MSALLDGLILGFNRNLDYAKRLMADVPADRIAHAPAPKFTHPAWVFSHMIIYHRPIEAMITGEPFDDPKGHKYGMGTEATPDPSLYPSKDELMAAFISGHDKIVAALQKHGDAALEKDTPLERWRVQMPKVGVVLPYLMLVHESTHLGQISMWRRVQGMPSV